MNINLSPEYLETFIDDALSAEEALREECARTRRKLGLRKTDTLWADRFPEIIRKAAKADMANASLWNVAQMLGTNDDNLVRIRRTYVHLYDKMNKRGIEILHDGDVIQKLTAFYIPDRKKYYYGAYSIRHLYNGKWAVTKRGLCIAILESEEDAQRLIDRRYE